MTSTVKPNDSLRGEKLRMHMMMAMGSVSLIVAAWCISWGSDVGLILAALNGWSTYDSFKKAKHIHRSLDTWRTLEPALLPFGQGLGELVSKGVLSQEAADAAYKKAVNIAVKRLHEEKIRS
jgi:hypothetical protein